MYFIQAGAFQNPAEADNQKARLAILGFESNVETGEPAGQGHLVPGASRAVHEDRGDQPRAPVAGAERHRRDAGQTQGFRQPEGRLRWIERRRTLTALLALAPLVARAQPSPPLAGEDYTEVSPAQPVEVPGKIEVVEFFWYGCPHCYSLEPLLEKWVARLPADVNFRRVPAVLNEGWAKEAADFYSFEALGVLQRLHRPFFDAIHRDQIDVRDPKVLADWLTKNGVDAKRFDEAFKSFGVQSKVRRAMQVTAAYRIDGTPAFAIAGLYTVSAQQGRTQDRLLSIVDYLSDVVRKSGKF